MQLLLSKLTLTTTVLTTSLLESNYPIRESVYNANGYDLSDAADVRSMLQQAMGNAQINFGGRTFENPQAALDHLASRKDVQESIQDMRRELEAGNRFMDPSKSFKHVDLIEFVMAQAKDKLGHRSAKTRQFNCWLKNRMKKTGKRFDESKPSY